MATLVLNNPTEQRFAFTLHFPTCEATGEVEAGHKQAKLSVPDGCKAIEYGNSADHGRCTVSFDPPIVKGEVRVLTLGGPLKDAAHTAVAAPKKQNGSAAAPISRDTKLGAETEQRSGSEKEEGPSTLCMTNMTAEKIIFQLKYAHGSAEGHLPAQPMSAKLKIPSGCIGLSWWATSMEIDEHLEFERPLEAGGQRDIVLQTPGQIIRAERESPPPTWLPDMMHKAQAFRSYPFFSSLTGPEDPQLKALCSELEKGDKKFVDGTFDLAKQNCTKHLIEWLRPDEIFDVPTTLWGKKKPKHSVRRQSICHKVTNAAKKTVDLSQGKLGDCWLIATLAMLYNYSPDLLQPVIALHRPDLGLVVCRFSKIGRWRYVVIDDRLPTVGGRLIYASHLEPGKLWGPFIEKAYAKLMGSYRNIQGGLVSYAATDLTGHITTTTDIRAIRKAADKNGDGKLDVDEMMALVKRYQRGREIWDSVGIRSLDSCMIYSARGEVRRDDGLIAGHAYTILQMKVVMLEGQDAPNFLFNLRNPWGHDEWNGLWSDKDTIWQTPYLARQIDHINANDGTIWMSAEDFLQRFDTMHTTLLFESKECKAVVNVEYGQFPKWAGGCGQGGHKGELEWAKNPQYAFTWNREAGEKSLLTVFLLQSDVVWKSQKMATQDTAAFRSIGLQVWRADGLEEGEPMRKPQTGCLAFVSTYKHDRRVAINLNHLPPGDYIAVPTTFKPCGTKNLFFMMTVTSTEQINLKPLTCKPHLKIRSRSIIAERLDPQKLSLMKSLVQEHLDDDGLVPPPPTQPSERSSAQSKGGSSPISASAIGSCFDAIQNIGPRELSESAAEEQTLALDLSHIDIIAYSRSHLRQSKSRNKTGDFSVGVSDLSQFIAGRRRKGQCRWR